MVIDLLSSGLSVGCFLFFIWGLIKPKNPNVKGSDVLICWQGGGVGI